MQHFKYASSQNDRINFLFCIFIIDLVIGEVESLTLALSENVLPSEKPSHAGKELDSEVQDEPPEQGNQPSGNSKKCQLPQLFSRYDSHTQKKKADTENTVLTVKNQFEVNEYDPTEGRCHVFQF